MNKSVFNYAMAEEGKKKRNRERRNEGMKERRKEGKKERKNIHFVRYFVYVHFMPMRYGVRLIVSVRISFVNSCELSSFISWRILATFCKAKVVSTRGVPSPRQIFFNFHGYM